MLRPEKEKKDEKKNRVGMGFAKGNILYSRTVGRSPDFFDSLVSVPASDVPGSVGEVFSDGLDFLDRAFKESNVRLGR